MEPTYIILGQNIYYLRGDEVVGLETFTGDVIKGYAKNKNFVNPIFDIETNMFSEGASESEILQYNNSRLALLVKYPELEEMNIQLLQLDNLPGIKRLEPISDKGLKGEKKYVKDGQLIWSITTRYWFEQNSPFPEGVVKVVKLFTIGGDVSETWSKEVVLSVDDKEQIRKEQRERILTYFKSQQEVLFNFLYVFFKMEIDDYVAVGDKEAFEFKLEDAAANHPYQEGGQYVVRLTLNQQIPTQTGGTTTVLQGIIALLIMIISFIIFPLLFVMGISYTFGKHIWDLDYSVSRQLQPIVRSISLSLDGLACAGSGELLNDILKITGSIKYGKWYQSISAVTGLIYIYEKDTWLRRFLDKAFRIFEKDHCIKSISDQDKYYYQNQSKIPPLMKNST
jgi:hypothetical protein